MPINRIECPECSAPLKSASGFKPGETVCCPKCETYFVVEKPSGDDEPKSKSKAAPAKAAPAKSAPPASAKKKPVKAAPLSDDDDDDEDEDEEDERPKSKKKGKKKRDDDEEEWSYKNSWIRYAILAVLITVMGVLGYKLYEKQQREKNSRVDEPAMRSVLS